MRQKDKTKRKDQNDKKSMLPYLLLERVVLVDIQNGVYFQKDISINTFIGCGFRFEKRFRPLI